MIIIIIIIIIMIGASVARELSETTAALRSAAVDSLRQEVEAANT